MSSNEHYHHDHQQTELKKALDRGLRKIEPYTNQILIVLLALTIVTVIGIFWFRSARVQDAQAWSEFANSRAPEDFLALADRHGNSSVGQWSRLQAGRMFLDEGLTQALTNRDASDESLEQARAAFDSLLQNSDNRDIRAAALYGMATALEALSDGDNGPAIEAYRKLSQDFPESQNALWAAARARELESESASQFYVWFRQQRPKPADRPAPRDFSIPSDDLPFDLQFPPGGESMPDLPPLSDSLPGTSPLPDAPEIPDAGESPGATPRSVPDAPEAPPASDPPPQPENAPSAPDGASPPAPNGEATAPQEGSPGDEPTAEAPSQN